MQILSESEAYREQACELIVAKKTIKACKVGNVVEAGVKCWYICSKKTIQAEESF